MLDGTVGLGHPVRHLGVPHQERLPRPLGLVKLLDFGGKTSAVRFEGIGLGPAGAVPYLHGRLETGADVGQPVAGLAPGPQAEGFAVHQLRGVLVLGRHPA